MATAPGRGRGGRRPPAFSTSGCAAIAATSGSARTRRCSKTPSATGPRSAGCLSDILELSRWKIGEEITAPEGILFVPYGTLRSSRVEDTRLDQIVRWAGSDFEGVIVFDEAHEMGGVAGGEGALGQKEGSLAGHCRGAAAKHPPARPCALCLGHRGKEAALAWVPAHMRFRALTQSEVGGESEAEPENEAVAEVPDEHCGDAAPEPADEDEHVR